MNQDGFLNPGLIIKSLPLKDGMIVCDFGCGSGGWVVPISKEIKKGAVYAIDMLEEAISALNGRISAEGLLNITTMLADVENGVKLKDEFADLVIMSNLLFQVKNRKYVVEEGKRVLKKGGMILVVDWNKGAPIGPRQTGTCLEEVRSIADELELKAEDDFGCGNFHWGVILRKI